MASMNYVVRQLQELGLSAEVNGETVYCEDIDLDFDRSHDGVRGVSRWLVETREEYAEVMRELHEDSLENQADLGPAEIALEEELLANKESPSEEPWTYEEALGHSPGYNPNQPLSDESLEAEEAYITEEESVTDTRIEKAQDKAEFTPAPPEKEHVIDSAQLALAKELNMSPKEVTQAAKVDDQDRGGIPNPETYDLPAVVVLVKGQRFLAPEGWKIKESRPSGKVVWYGSIYQTRKTKNEARGAEFSLVRV